MAEEAENQAVPPGSPKARLIRDRDGIRNFIADLAEPARREIAVFAPGLDAHFFNSTRLSRALASFAARHRHNQARFLVEDGAQAMRDNDRIVALCRRLSDFIQLRQVGEEHLGIREMFVVVDRQGYLYQQDVTEPECLAHASDGKLAVELTGRFREMWERSIPVPGLLMAGLSS